MVTMDGRDPASFNGIAAKLFAHATERNMIGVRWELGFFVHRDLIRSTGRKLEGEPWRPIESLWGCEVRSSGFEDDIALICNGNGKTVRLLAKEV